VLANSHVEAKTFVTAFICIFVNIYRRFPLISLTIPYSLFKKIYRLFRYIFIDNNYYCFHSSRFVLNLSFYFYFILLTVHAIGRNTRYNFKKKFDESPPNSDNNISPKYYFKIKKTFDELTEI